MLFIQLYDIHPNVKYTDDGGHQVQSPSYLAPSLPHRPSRGELKKHKVIVQNKNLPNTSSIVINEFEKRHFTWHCILCFFLIKLWISFDAPVFFSALSCAYVLMNLVTGL